MTGHLRHPWRLIAPFVLLLLLPQVLLVWPGWSPPQLAENRVLATVPEPLSSLADLDRFRGDTDAWVADRFPARTVAIVGLNALRHRLGYSGTAHVRVGEEGWLFYDNGAHLPQVRASTLTPDAVDAWADEFIRREGHLAARGIRYYVLAPPVKERVYPERVAGWLRRPEGPSDSDLLATETRSRGSSGFLAPLRGLLERKAEGVEVYSPYDTHWTGQGAHVGYHQLLVAMAADGLPVAPRPVSSFDVREPEPARREQDLAHMLGIASFVRQRFAYLEDASVQSDLRTTHLGEATDWTADRVMDTGREGPVMLFMGDSFSNSLLPMLLPHFSRVVFAHHQNGFHRDDLIERFEPDVVVLEVLDSGIRHAMPAAVGIEAEGEPGVDVVPPRAVEAWLDIEGDLAAGRATYQCSLDHWQAMADAPGRFRTSGWFADVSGRRVPATVDVVLQDGDRAWAFTLPVDQSRPDVAAYFKVDTIAGSGFDAAVEASPLPAGDYAVHLQAEFDGRWLRCRTLQVVTIAGGSGRGQH